MTEEHISEIKTFEDFNKAINESHDEGCGHCFSFHHYKHLDPIVRHIAYLGFIGDDTYNKALIDELERRESLPLDDNIYWMATCVEPGLGNRIVSSYEQQHTYISMHLVMGSKFIS